MDEITIRDFWYDHLEYAKDDHVQYIIDGHKMTGIIMDYNSHCNMYIIDTDRNYNAIYPKDIIDFFQNDGDVKEQDLEKLQDQLDRLFADLDDNSQGCNHSYKHYVGLTEVYDYCIKCDHKKL